MLFDFSNPSATALQFLSSGLKTCDDVAYHEVLESIKGLTFCDGLLDYQIDGVAFLASRSGAILADDMGLGKTCQAISSTMVNPSERLPVLIICPSGLRYEWLKEIKRVSPHSSISLPVVPSEWTPSDYTVISFSRLKDFFGWDILHSFKSLFIDESQGFKNSTSFNKKTREDAHTSLRNGEKPKGHRTALCIDIAKCIPNVYCLTGTPILSRPRELFNLLALVRSPLSKDFIRFSKRYCDGHRGPFGWIADGCTNAVELRERLKNTLLRRLKKDVLNLPPKTTITTKLALHGNFILDYKNAWNRYVGSIQKTKSSEKRVSSLKARHLVEINLLRQVACLSKVSYLSNRITSSSEKLIVFSNFKEPIDALSGLLDGGNIRHVRYVGGMTEAARNKAVEEFRSNTECRVFVSNLEAGKTGLNLVEATRVVFLDMGFTPADHFQAEDRAHRIGQTLPVTCEYLVTIDTVDELMLSILSEKKAVIDRIFGDDYDSAPAESDFDIQNDFFERVKAASIFPSPQKPKSPSNAVSNLSLLF